jgi:phosphoribosyl 1,2-cyclic phosphodiesterase
MIIRFLGVHSRETLTTRCVSILLDQSIALDAGCLTSKLSITEQHKISAVLLTHSHFDHLRDVPSLAINAFREGINLKFYSTAGVHRAIEQYMLNGSLYPQFQHLPLEAPSVTFQELVPGEAVAIDGYKILVFPVNHPGDAVGYRITDKHNHGIFYTGDTGSVFSNGDYNVSTHLLITEVTFPNRHEQQAIVSNHLTPALLYKGLTEMRNKKGWLPEVIVVHRDPAFENEIREEISQIIPLLETEITLVNAGTELRI